ncbi:MAG: response regulator [Roseobacter sp.]
MQEHVLVADNDRLQTVFLERQTNDLVVLDLIFPDQDGSETAKRLQRESDLPIIMLSARNEIYDALWVWSWVMMIM